VAGSGIHLPHGAVAQTLELIRYPARSLIGSLPRTNLRLIARSVVQNLLILFTCATSDGILLLVLCEPKHA
jgi:hypothetical protein